MTGAVEQFVIRHESLTDGPAVRLVNEAAFDTNAEADLVDALRENGKFALSLVGEADGAVVGHILFTDIEIEPGGRQSGIAGLAPMAVLPAWQGKGVGSALVRHGLKACAELGYRAVVVLGAPAFYGRFGFVPAREYGVTSEYPDAGDAFMAVQLCDAAVPDGRACYQPEFGRL